MVTKIKKQIKLIVHKWECKIQISYGHNPLPSNFPLHSISNFEVVAIDLVSMPVSRGYNHLLTIIDLQSRLFGTVLLSNIRAEMVANFFFKCWICVYDAPSVVHSDQALQFVSSVFKSLGHTHKIAVTHSSTFHRKGNSIIERVHRTLKNRLRWHTPCTSWL